MPACLRDWAVSRPVKPAPTMMTGRGAVELVIATVAVAIAHDARPTG